MNCRVLTTSIWKDVITDQSAQFSQKEVKQLIADAQGAGSGAWSAMLAERQLRRAS
jgi:hypothetical protein